MLYHYLHFPNISINSFRILYGVWFGFVFRLRRLFFLSPYFPICNTARNCELTLDGMLITFYFLYWILFCSLMPWISLKRGYQVLISLYIWWSSVLPTSSESLGPTKRTLMISILSIFHCMTITNWFENLTWISFYVRVFRNSMWFVCVLLHFAAIVGFSFYIFQNYHAVKMSCNKTLL